MSVNVYNHRVTAALLLAAEPQLTGSHRETYDADRHGPHRR